MLLPILALAQIAAAPPQPAVPARLKPLQRQLDTIAAGFHGVLGYSFHHLKRGDVLTNRGDERFPTASTIKLAVLGTAMEKLDKGELGYFDRREITPDDVRGGAGFLQNYKPGSKVELKELLHLMITVSDNTATVMLARWLGTLNVNAWLDRHGLQNTRLLTVIPDGEKELLALREEWGLGVTTPNEMRELMEQIVCGKAGSPAATEEMQRILSHQYFDEGIPSQCPPWIATGSKSGAIEKSRSEVAIVHSPSGDYVLSVYTKENQDTRWTDDNEGEVAISAIASAIWRFYHPKDKWRPAGPVGKKAS